MSNKIVSATIMLSFDFEMRWGVHNVYGLDFSKYRKNLDNCRAVVTSMLKLLAERNLNATWATVGALGLNNWQEYFMYAPKPPKYINSKLLVQEEYAKFDPNGQLHFAPDLIHKIIQTKGQDLGSHSFSHLYFCEPGVTEIDFLDDMFALEELFKNRFGVNPVSFIYPCNQIKFSELLNKTSVKIFRTREPAWFYDCVTAKDNTIVPKFLRFIDSINPLVKRSSKCAGAGASSVRASLFLRFNLPKALWGLQMNRVKNELNSLNDGEVFHCWWHPHNLGFDLNVGIARLVQVLDLIAELCVKKNIKSMNMRNFYEQAGD